MLNTKFHLYGYRNSLTSETLGLFFFFLLYFIFLFFLKYYRRNKQKKGN